MLSSKKRKEMNCLRVRQAKKTEMRNGIYLVNKFDRSRIRKEIRSDFSDFFDLFKELVETVQKRITEWKSECDSR